MTTELEERIIKHVSYSHILKIIETLEQVKDNELASNQVQTIGRITEVISLFEESLRKIDPLLVSIVSMNNMNTILQNILNNLINFKSNNNQQYLDAAVAQIENLLPYLTQFLIPKNLDDIEGIKHAVVSFRKSIAQHLSNVEKEAMNSLEALTYNTEKLEELSKVAENQKGRVDTIINEIQNQFSDAHATRKEAFSEFLISSNKSFESHLSSFGDEYSNFVLEQSEVFKKIEKDFIEMKKTQDQSFEKIINDSNSIFETELEKIKEMNKEAEKILGIMSMKGLAQGYQKIADKEERQSLYWNVASILSMLGILWFGYEFIILHSGTMGLADLISRMLLTGVGITLFTYCAKQASNHRNEERRNRKIELELASLNPYLKDLEENDQKKVKHSLVEKYFGVDLPNPSNSKEKVQLQQNLVESISSDPKLIQNISDRVIDLINANK